LKGKPQCPAIIASFSCFQSSSFLYKRWFKTNSEVLKYEPWTTVTFFIAYSNWMCFGSFMKDKESGLSLLFARVPQLRNHHNAIPL
jgi:hypothetical protein